MIKYACEKWSNEKEEEEEYVTGLNLQNGWKESSSLIYEEGTRIRASAAWQSTDGIAR